MPVSVRVCSHSYLGGLLKSHDGRRLEAKIGFEVLGDLTDKTLERELADKELGGLLVFADFAERHGAWAVAVRLLHTTGGWGGLPGGLLAYKRR
jgi:hypothetical protein